jgi:hypothetical protein
MAFRHLALQIMVPGTLMGTVENHHAKNDANSTRQFDSAPGHQESNMTQPSDAPIEPVERMSATSQTSEENVKETVAAAIVTAMCMSAWPETVDAQGLPHTCPARPTRVVKGPNDQTLTVCLDGKYSTCLRDAQRLGRRYQEAKAFCDTRPLRRDL